MRTSLASLIAVLATASSLVAGNPTSTSRIPLNPDPSVLTSRSNVVGARAPRPQPAAPITNAKRLARGLPLNKPYRRSDSPNARHAKRSALPPVSITGNILVTSLDKQTVFGFIAPTFNVFGEYGLFVDSQTAALQVSFSYQADDPSALSIKALNGPDATSPYFGGVVGYSSSSDDLGPVGNPNYNYLAGTGETLPGAPPSDTPNSFEDATSIDEDAESAIWSYDPLTQALTPQWINTDGSSPANTLVYVAEEPLLAITGDYTTFQNFYGVGVEIAFMFVPT